MTVNRLLTAVPILAGAIAAAWSPNAQAGPCGNTEIDINGADALYQAINDNGPGKIGPRRLVVNQSGTIQFIGTRTFVQGTPMDIDSVKIRLKKTDGKNRTKVTICSTDAGGTQRVLKTFEVPRGRGNIGQVFEHTITGVKNRRISVRLVGQSTINTMSYNLDVIRPDAGKRWEPRRSISSGPVVGFADIHNHHAAPHAFGGGVVAGDMNASQRFPSCTTDHSRSKTGLAGFAVKEHPESGTDAPATEFYETGHGYGCHVTEGGKTRCWADGTHNKMGKVALKQAHDNGLQLMVTHAVNNQALCFIAASLKPRDTHCADMESAKKQIYEMKRFADSHSWYTIVRDPWEARRAIARGELAVVLGVEVSNILPISDGNYIKQLHDLYDMGVRSLYMTHESDSQFAGAAYHHWPAMLANNELKQIKNLLTGTGQANIMAWLNQPTQDIANNDPIGAPHNPVRMTSAGKLLTREMMRLNMLIDIDHLSRGAIDDIYVEAKNNRYYPLYAGHTRIKNLLADGHTRNQTMELVATRKILNYITKTGGMVGLRTGPEEMKTYAEGNAPNDCHGSVKSFAQFYEWYADRGYKVAFGTDLNGFVPSFGPRWGPNACPLAKGSTGTSQRAAQGPLPRTVARAPAGWSTYTKLGMVDIGTLPSVVHDMKHNLGVDTGPLERSAEDFLVMWERTYSASRTKVDTPKLGPHGPIEPGKKKAAKKKAAKKKAAKKKRVSRPAKK
ncbi:MAG: membrane dipeptidase [Nannocystaceae bacterium]|nr:membrane dipeptidase [Nannocystaceae bacterium]